MQKQKPVRLPAGGIIQYSQLHERPERKNRSAPVGFGRDGLEKQAVTATPAITAGMKRQTDGKALSAYHHGIAQLDEPLQGNKSYEGRRGNVPTHPNMVTQSTSGDRLRRKHDPQSGNAILDEAGRLGAPRGGWRRAADGSVK